MSMRDASVSVYPFTIHCNPATLAFRSVPIVGSATLTTVASRNAMPDPSTVASRTQRAVGVPHVTASSLANGPGTFPSTRTIVLDERLRVNGTYGFAPRAGSSRRVRRMSRSMCLEECEASARVT